MAFGASGYPSRRLRVACARDRVGRCWCSTSCCILRSQWKKGVDGPSGYSQPARLIQQLKEPFVHKGARAHLRYVQYET